MVRRLLKKTVYEYDYSESVDDEDSDYDHDDSSEDEEFIEETDCSSTPSCSQSTVSSVGIPTNAAHARDCDCRVHK
jgi:hypothetical protein